MSEIFEIIDPVESFLEARQEGFGVGVESPRCGHNRALWLAGAAVCLFMTLILANTLGPRIRGEFALQLNREEASDTVSEHRPQQPENSDLALIPAAPTPASRVHAIDPEASAAPSSDSQVQTSQEPAPPPTLAEGQFSAPNSLQPDEVISRAEDERAGWVTTSLAATVHSGPSVSTPILKYYPVGTELRTIGRQNGWVQIVDPATSQQGWIYEPYLWPGKVPTERQGALPQQPDTPNSEQQPTQAELDAPDESGVSDPDVSEPAEKSEELRKSRGFSSHHARRGIWIRFGNRTLRFGF